MELRSYQLEQVGRLRQGIRDKHLAQMLMSPTGSGKTEVAKAIIASSQRMGRRAWFIVDGIKLLDQTLARFRADGLIAGAIQSDHPCTDYGRPIQIATVQSLRQRLGFLLANCRPDVVLIDEAHVVHKVHIDLINWCKANGVPVVGLSATPFRKGLGKIYDSLVSCITTTELTQQGYLVPTTCFAPFVPSLTGVKTNSDGDWVEDELAEVMGEAKLIGDIVQHWKELASGRKTLVFACNVNHARDIAEKFFDSGVMAAHIDGYMPQKEIEENIRLHQKGTLKVLVSVAMLIKGYDDPSISCLVNARPTQSLMLHYQMLGRGLRPSPGKRDCIIIDHAGNLLRNGLATDPLPDRLDTGDGEPLDRRQPQKQDEERKLKPCPTCSFLFRGLLCPSCGHAIQIQAGIAVAAGKLIKLDDRRKVLGQQNKQQVFAELLGFARAHGKRDGWAWYAYQAFMKEPPGRSWAYEVIPSTPSEQIATWVKGYNIRRAKRYAKYGS